MVGASEREIIDSYLSSWRNLANLLKQKGKRIISRGVIGELLIWDSLRAKGFEAEYMGGGKKNYDIKVKVGGKELTIDSKEKTGDKWVLLHLSDYWEMEDVKENEPQRVKTIKDNQPDFYIFVDVQKFVDTNRRDFYVFSKQGFCEYARDNYIYLNKPRPKNNKSTDFWLMPEEIVKYLDNELSTFQKHNV